MSTTTVTAYDRLLDALRAHGSRVNANGTNARAQCPAHDDRNPSLSVRRIEGQVLAYCFAGCEVAEVLGALGMATRDLFDEPRGARYDYTDATGVTVLRTVRRTPDKRFRQRVHDRSVVPLYRLPALAKAVEDEETVYVVEGEKDVHALESLGAVATTAPQGASNWHHVDPSPLYGAKVVVVADADDSGDRYARAVVESLDGMVPSLTVMRAKVGKDAAEHVAAGYGLADLVPHELGGYDLGEHAAADYSPRVRELRLTPASRIRMRPVRWLWAERLPLGTVSLLGGREGVGKSTVGYTLAASVTRGKLAGQYEHEPKSVIVAATEDSWSHTIVPRLVGADADLDRVYRVDVTTATGVEASLVLPRDLSALEDAVHETDAAMILLDPLISRLDSKLDSHKDAEVRAALEPLTSLADRTETSVVGLIHVNKSSSTDPLTSLMASRAFAAIARAVLFVMADPDDEATRLLGEPKNNLGRSDNDGLPTLTFRIEPAHVADTDEGPVWTGRVRWLGEREQSIRDALEAAGESADARSATDEAADWLADYLTSKGGTDDSATIKREGAKAGHTKDALKRARRKINTTVESEGFPRRTYWTLRGTAAQREHEQ